jgi:hypothetical protein
MAWLLKKGEAHSASGGPRGKWPHPYSAATAEPDLAGQGFTGIEPRCEGCRLRVGVEVIEPGKSEVDEAVGEKVTGGLTVAPLLTAMAREEFIRLLGSPWETKEGIELPIYVGEDLRGKERTYDFAIYSDGMIVSRLFQGTVAAMDIHATTPNASSAWLWHWGTGSKNSIAVWRAE